MRKLAPDEAALWARVAATIRPLHPVRDPDTKDEAPAPPAPVKPPIERKPKGPAPRLPTAAPAARQRPGETLDSGWDKKLRGGAVVPDRVLDLHGHDLDRAWHAIDGTLEAALLAGDRVVLLITGHARAGEPPIARGRIRAAVHDWLRVSRHASRIAAVRNAHRRHGGGGSLYIILRRDKRMSTFF